MILTDDCDLYTNYLDAYFGGNGDIYISIVVENKEGLRTSHPVRISTSGGVFPTEIKIAAATIARIITKTKKP